MKAVITGATGAVGMALIKELTERGDEILVLCRSSSARSKRIPDTANIKKIDCPLDKMNELELDEKYDAFFHFAWEGTTGEARNDMYLQNRNVKHTLDAVALAARLGCSVFVGAGSQAEYGRVEGDLNASVPAFPENGYGMGKLCAGQMSRVMCSQLGIRHIWTRILSVYGEYDGANSLISFAIGKALAGERASFTAGEQVWDYLYSGDAAKAMVALAERGRDGGIYCLGSGKKRLLREYLEVLRDTANPDAELGLGDRPYPDKQVMYLCADISDLVRDTGYAPQTEFEDGIKKTVEWYKTKEEI